MTGQDGAYLARLLIDKGYQVYGTYRRLSTPNFWRLQYLGIFENINLIPSELSDTTSILEAIQIAHPDEVYNLAAQSFVEASFEVPLGTAEVSGLAVTRFLEAIRQLGSKARFYQASSSEMFGGTNHDEAPLKEDDRFSPLSPYAAAKLYGHSIVNIYRKAYGVFACSGILFNHESSLRGLEFVTRKISNACAKIKLGLQKDVSLGNLDAKRDWGYAPEYVEGIWRILQQDEPNDYVMATGKAHSVAEFAQQAFELVGLDWKEHVKRDKRFLRPLDVGCLVGDATRASRALGWFPKTDFKQTVKIMVDEDLNRWNRWLKGERFPWDAPNYPSEARILTRALRM